MWGLYTLRDAAKRLACPRTVTTRSVNANAVCEQRRASFRPSHRGLPRLSGRRTESAGDGFFHQCLNYLIHERRHVQGDLSQDMSNDTPALLPYFSSHDDIRWPCPTVLPHHAAYYHACRVPTTRYALGSYQPRTLGGGNTHIRTQPAIWYVGVLGYSLA